MVRRENSQDMRMPNPFHDGDLDQAILSNHAEISMTSSYLFEDVHGTFKLQIVLSGLLIRVASTAHI
jgi:hypothetical protein